jgi:hypothetical protein
MLSYFYMNQWKFHSDNTRNLMKLLENESPIDAQNLKFNVSTVDWKLLVRNSWISGRRYLLKESDHNIDKAIHRRQLWGKKVLNKNSSKLTFLYFFCTELQIAIVCLSPFGIFFWRMVSIGFYWDWVHCYLFRNNWLTTCIAF